MSADSNNSERLVAVARLLKRHSFKENKWKAVASSGKAAPWLEKLESIYLGDLEKEPINNIKIAAKIEVPLSHSSEFFISFDESFEARPGTVFVERSFFPKLSNDEFYLCDLLTKEIQSDRGVFKLTSFYENGDPIGGVSSLTLLLEGSEGRTVEVPLGTLERKESAWCVRDIDLWLDIGKAPQSDEEN